MKSGWAIKKLGEVCEEVKDRTSSIGVVLSAYITTDNMLKDCAGVCEAENLPPKVTKATLKNNYYTKCHSRLLSML